jgi:hypothetical protein
MRFINPLHIRVFALLSFAVVMRADERAQKLMDRLASEAEAFQKIAPEMVGRETLHQGALTAPPRFMMRLGDTAAVWKEREMVSEYGFALLGGREIHELRQVTLIDGKPITRESKAQEALAKLVTGSDDQRKRLALQQFEKFGLRGGATDFGQILLLFSRNRLEHYEFTAAGPRLLGRVPAQVFHYQQLDGPQALTVFRGNSSGGSGPKPQRLSVQGEIWVRESDGLPLRITMTATDKPLREEATVDYAMSEFGTLLPVETMQRELRGDQQLAENHFTYDGFHRFRAQH